MPLTEKGEKVKAALQEEYGAEKGEQVLYAGKNKGTFTGIDRGDDSKGPAIEKHREKDSVGVKEPKESGGAQKQVEATEDLPTELRSAEDELEQLEREQEQTEESQERQNAIEDAKGMVRQLRKDIKDQAREALNRSDDESPLEKAERDDAWNDMATKVHNFCDAFEKRMDAFERKKEDCN
jgi:hypothetical protein